MLKTALLFLMAFICIAAGINHFWHPQTYLRIMPPYFPYPQFLNYAAGIAEILLGLLLFFSATRKVAAWCIAALLILFFTVHIYMLQQALHTEDYFVSPAMAWLRLALQPVLIAWALWYRK